MGKGRHDGLRPNSQWRKQGRAAANFWGGYTGWINHQLLDINSVLNNEWNRGALSLFFLPQNNEIPHTAPLYCLLSGDKMQATIPVACRTIYICFIFVKMPHRRAAVTAEAGGVSGPINYPISQESLLPANIICTEHTLLTKYFRKVLAILFT